jgi:hypothetical protein
MPLNGALLEGERRLNPRIKFGSPCGFPVAVWLEV